MDWPLTEAEALLGQYFLVRCGWVTDLDDALVKYTSLSSGERYVIDVLQYRSVVPAPPEMVVDGAYAVLVQAVIDERTT